MPVTGSIPLPLSPGDAFGQGVDIMNKLLSAPIENKLRQAQTEEAYGKAYESKILSNLLAMATGQQPTSSTASQTNNQSQGNQPYQLTSQDKTGIGNLKPGEAYTIPQSQGIQNAQGSQGFQGTAPSNRPNLTADKALLLAGALKLPTQVIEGKLVTPFGTYTIGETPEEKRKGEQKLAFQKELGGSDVKIMEDWNKTITASHESQPNLEMVRDISANPTFQDMYKRPEYFGKDIEWYSRFGKDHGITDEQIGLLASFDTNLKDLYKSTASDFKGAFREFEKKLFDQALPGKTDSLQQIIAKTNTILALRRLVSQRLTLAQNIVRSMPGEISPANALEMADKQIGTKKIFKQVQDEFKKSQKEQLAEKNAKEKNEGNINTVGSEGQQKDQLQIWADNAIANGANKDLVNKRLNELRSK